jgi:hypothetical protein
VRHPTALQQRAFVSGTSQPNQEQDERRPDSASAADVTLPGRENTVFDQRQAVCQLTARTPQLSTVEVSVRGFPLNFIWPRREVCARD